MHCFWFHLFISAVIIIKYTNKNYDSSNNILAGFCENYNGLEELSTVEYTTQALIELS